MTPMTYRACPVCSESKATPIFSKKGCRYVRCLDCGMVYINPIPPEEEISDVYQHYGKTYFTQSEKLRVDFAVGRYDREIGLLRRVDAKGRLLDVGCATGSFLVVAKNAGFEEVHGVEIAQWSVDHARGQGLTVHAGDFTNRMFPDARFEVITMWATLEHLSNPREFVGEAYRLLCPSGFLAVSVPNMLSLSQAILGIKDRYVGSDHLNYFVPTTMRRLLEDAGFKVIRTETRGINPLTILGDLRGSKVSVDSQISGSVRTLEIKTSMRYAPIRLAHRMIAILLYWIGRGDLLLMAAQKPQR